MFLEGHVVSRLTEPGVRYRTLIALNVLRIVEREVPGREANQELCERIRTGAADAGPWRARVPAYVGTMVEEKLAVAGAIARVASAIALRTLLRGEQSVARPRRPRVEKRRVIEGIRVSARAARPGTTVAVCRSAKEARPCGTRGIGRSRSQGR